MKRVTTRMSDCQKLIKYYIAKCLGTSTMTVPTPSTATTLVTGSFGRPPSFWAHLNGTGTKRLHSLAPCRRSCCVACGAHDQPQHAGCGWTRRHICLLLFVRMAHPAPDEESLVVSITARAVGTMRVKGTRTAALTSSACQR